MSLIVIHHLVFCEEALPEAILAGQHQMQRHSFYFKTMPSEDEISNIVQSLNSEIRFMGCYIIRIEVFKIEITPEQACDFVDDYFLKSANEEVMPKRVTTLVKTVIL